MMPTMEPSMMFGMGAAMLFWIVLAALLCLVVIGVATWLMLSWLKKQRTPTRQEIAQPQDAYRAYEQGYQLHQQPLEANQEGGLNYLYPQLQYEQPQVQYPETISSEH